MALSPAKLTLTKELPGRTSAYRVAEVRARVSGIVLKRLFKEGSDVKEGEVLYQIDPAPYEAALDSAKGALARAEAGGTSARLQADRYAELLKAKALSRQDYDNSQAALKASEADIAAAAAAVQGAEINLGYTRVTAPIAGHIGRSEITEGAYVQQSQATLLAVIRQIDRLYVDLSQSSSEVLRLKKELRSGRLQRVGADEARVKLLLEDGTAYAEPGVLQFADVSVDETTGSIGLRAIFPNSRGELLPGMFVRARLEEGVNPDALLVPQSAVTRNQRGEAVAMLVGAGGKVEARTFSTDRAIGDRWVVAAGLKAGDRIILNNLQRIRPGVAVTAVTVEAGTSSVPPAVR